MFRMFGSILDVLEQGACLGAIDNSTLLLKRSQTAVVDMCDAMMLADAVVCSAAAAAAAAVLPFVSAQCPLSA